MKTLLIISIMLFSGSDFCEGWNSGYSDGYCFELSDACPPPLVPVCEIPNIGLSGYNGGYQQGFAKGIKDYQKFKKK